eukprot:CAMPEP_0206492230 /NCGR_PEP_ID=MMETSP0324_2-20121206/45856_1 /ASSEMBLY_ACC=CAM_ASM_000836 /TAXON_ID=2866 /ORGANISM="Crypthecodinium cohnii, Strain Seligo" /LENGTH=56 /DNA_ID=CAMNT_0053974349 /DNA_START=70 /DNA_END=236 /DNA_ORIENTATION=+
MCCRRMSAQQYLQATVPTRGARRPGARTCGMDDWQACDMRQHFVSSGRAIAYFCPP